MKSRFLGYDSAAMLAVLVAMLYSLPVPAAAQQTQVAAKAAAASPSPAAASPAPPPAEDVAKNAMPSSAQPAPGTPLSIDGHPDLTGNWFNYRGNNMDVKQVGNTRINLQVTSRAPESEDPENNLSINTRIYTSVAARRADPNKPSYKPEAQKMVARLDRMQSKLDPALCKLPGFLRVGAPHQIVQGPGVVAFLYDSSDASFDFFRIIPTDGRQHRSPDDTLGLSPSRNGDSIGKWEGDTLVVDTVDFNGEVWLGIDGWFTSPSLHVVERLRREGDILHYQATVEDPEVLTKPWVMPAAHVKLNRKSARIDQEEPPCVEMDSTHTVTPEHH